MTGEQVTFWVLAAVTVVSALAVITRRNPVHSAVWLIVTLLAVALLYVQLRAEFVAAVQIILYIGGIMVLFLFAIMLVDLGVAVRQIPYSRQWPVALLAAAALAAEFALFFWKRNAILLPPARPEALAPNAERIGDALYQTYVLPFEIASLLLLVAMVGAVLMAKRREPRAEPES
jgi:NADH-quinone oxidoreductase subunit J